MFSFITHLCHSSNNQKKHSINLLHYSDNYNFMQSIYIPYDKLHNISFKDDRWSKVVYYMERIMGGDISFQEGNIETKFKFWITAKGKVAVYNYWHSVTLVAPTWEAENFPTEFFLRLHEQILSEFRNIYL